MTPTYHSFPTPVFEFPASVRIMWYPAIGHFHVQVKDERGLSQHPVMHKDGSIAYDRPEHIRGSQMKWVRKAFRTLYGHMYPEE